MSFITNSVGFSNEKLFHSLFFYFLLYFFDVEGLNKRCSISIPLGFSIQQVNDATDFI